MQKVASRKWAAIDPLKIYTGYTAQVWNQFLTECYKNSDINTLTKTLYGLQAGMSDLVKKKLSDEKINNWFIRITRSLEKTISKIIREKNFNPCHDPEMAKKFMHLKGDKKRLDNEIEKFLKKERF